MPCQSLHLSSAGHRETLTWEDGLWAEPQPGVGLQSGAKSILLGAQGVALGQLIQPGQLGHVTSPLSAPTSCVCKMGAVFHMVESMCETPAACWAPVPPGCLAQPSPPHAGLWASLLDTFGIQMSEG